MEPEPAPTDVCGEVHVWFGQQEAWTELWLRLVDDPAGPTVLLFPSAAAEAAGGRGAASVVAEQPRVVGDATATGFRLEIPGAPRPEYLNANAALRAALLARCQYSQAQEQQQLAAEFPRRIGAEGRYWLGREVGAGGFARVYAGFDSATGERIACKVAKASYDESQKREIVLQAALQHPGIVNIRDVVYEPPPGGGAAQVGGNIFILMELVPGGELFKLVAKEKGM